MYVGMPDGALVGAPAAEETSVAEFVGSKRIVDGTVADASVFVPVGKMLVGALDVSVGAVVSDASVDAAGVTASVADAPEVVGAKLNEVCTELSAGTVAEEADEAVSDAEAVVAGNPVTGAVSEDAVAVAVGVRATVVPVLSGMSVEILEPVAALSVADGVSEALSDGVTAAESDAEAVAESVTLADAGAVADAESVALADAGVVADAESGALVAAGAVAEAESVPLGDADAVAESVSVAGTEAGTLEAESDAVAESVAEAVAESESESVVVTGIGTGTSVSELVEVCVAGASVGELAGALSDAAESVAVGTEESVVVACASREDEALATMLSEAVAKAADSEDARSGFALSDATMLEISAPSEDSSTERTLEAEASRVAEGVMVESPESVDVGTLLSVTVGVSVGIATLLSSEGVSGTTMMESVPDESVGDATGTVKVTESGSTVGMSVGVDPSVAVVGVLAEVSEELSDVSDELAGVLLSVGVAEGTSVDELSDESEELSGAGVLAAESEAAESVGDNNGALAEIDTSGTAVTGSTVIALPSLPTAEGNGIGIKPLSVD